MVNHDYNTRFKYNPISYHDYYFSDDTDFSNEDEKFNRKKYEY